MWWGLGTFQFVFLFACNLVAYSEAKFLNFATKFSRMYKHSIRFCQPTCEQYSSEWRDSRDIYCTVPNLADR